MEAGWGACRMSILTYQFTGSKEHADMHKIILLLQEYYTENALSMINVRNALKAYYLHIHVMNFNIDSMFF